MDALVAHYHEIGLKGRNRHFFEAALKRNLTRALRGTGYRKVRQLAGRIVVSFEEGALTDDVAEQAARVFGIAYVGAGYTVAPDLGQIGEVALELMEAEPFDSFRVRARRTHAVIPESSGDINKLVGQKIVDATGGRVDLKHADATAWI